MLPGEEIEELDELVPAEAAEELLERMLRYARFRGAAGWLRERSGLAEAVLYRSAPLPDELRRLSVEHAEASYDPSLLGAALGGLLRTPPPVDLSHMATPRVTLGERLALLRELLRRGAFAFDDAVRDADRMTVAVTLFALLELYKRGEASWDQAEPFAPITVTAGRRVTPLARIVEALLFLSPEPVSLDDLRDATEQDEWAVLDALTELRDGLHGRGVVLQGDRRRLDARHATRGRRRPRAACSRARARRR